MFEGWFITAGILGGLPAAEAGDVPVTFTRGGQATLVAVVPMQVSSQVVLRTFERCWTEPAAVQGGGSTIQIPEVERTVVFSVTPIDDENRAVGEVVAYPGPTSRWERNPVLIHTIEPPTWFRQWAEATGTRLYPADRRQLHRRKRPVKAEESELLILGRSSAGEGPEDVLKLADEENLNVLVLEAAWFGPSSRTTITVKPENTDGALAHLKPQHWNTPPQFNRRAGPWPGLTNRRAWVWFDELPMVEQIGPLSAKRRIVLSYLPWTQQLGRNDVADDLLEAIIRATADPHGDTITLSRLCMLHPQRLDLDDEKTVEERPVLSAAMQIGPFSAGYDLAVVDVRGTDEPPSELLQTLKQWEVVFDAQRPLLILGDDSLLDRWSWLSRQFDKPRAKPAGVIWLKNDTLGPGMAEQVRIMLALSQNGVPLTELAKEK